MPTTTLRAVAPPPLRPTERRFRALALIRSYDGVKTNDLTAIMGGSAHRLEEDLRVFAEHGFLRRERPGFTAEFRHFITPLGDDLLDTFGRAYPHSQELSCRLRRNRTEPSLHDQMVTDGTALIHAGIAALDGYQLRLRQDLITDAQPDHRDNPSKPFKFPVSIKHPGAHKRAKRTEITIEPDDVLDLTACSDNRRMALFVEAERTNTPYKKSLRQTSFFQKMLAYRYLRSRPGILAPFGITDFRVLVTAYSESKLESRVRVISDFTHGDADDLFLFKTLPAPNLPARERKALPNFALRWRRVGLEMVDLPALIANA